VLAICASSAVRAATSVVSCPRRDTHCAHVVAAAAAAEKDGAGDDALSAPPALLLLSRRAAAAEMTALLKE
jgi:hypothetical protein|tara:strand:- start:299 stop:511 length:213 start_codon:yes stop_codon:yes gene_type:complete